MKGENQFFMPERSFPDNVPAREICITGEERRQSSIYLQSLFNAGRAAADEDSTEKSGPWYQGPVAWVQEFVRSRLQGENAY